MNKRIFWLLPLLICTHLAMGQSELQKKQDWVDSVFQTLSTNEKIGQLFMVPVNPSNQDEVNELENKVKSHQVGGVIFLPGTPARQATVTKMLQEKADLPLLIALDAEWGLGMSLDSTISYPRNLVLGAIQDDSLIFQLGREVGRQLNRLGVNMNFAPVADVYAPSGETLLNYRSFGQNPNRVTEKELAFMNGMKTQHIQSCAKYFPVKGITVTEVLKGVPTIHPALDSLSLITYRGLFDNGLAGVIPAPTEFPLFYQNAGLIKKNIYNSASLTSLFTGDWLKKNLHFKGLSFTDVQRIQMRTEKYRAGEAETFAFQAGNDILLSPLDIGPAIRKIKKIIRKEHPFEEQLDATVKKILEVKYDAGLSKPPRIETDNLVRNLNAYDAQILKKKLYEAAVTVVSDKGHELPIKTLEGKHIAYITGETEKPNNDFYHYLSKYANISYYSLDGKTDMVELTDALAHQEIIIVGIFPQTAPEVLRRLDQSLSQVHSADMILYCDFGNENFLRLADRYDHVITGYVNTSETIQAMAEVIFGGRAANGRLPIALNSTIDEGTGLPTSSLQRLTHALPEEAGMDSRVLAQIDSIAIDAVRKKATPGCYVMVIKDGKIVFEKPYGHLAYDDPAPVTDETIYDLASLTKVSATLLAAMFLYEKGEIDLYKKVSVYLPELRNTNKKDITVIDMMTHQAGLVPFVPMWNLTVKDSVVMPEYYALERKPEFPLQVGASLFASEKLRDSVWTWVLKSKMIDKPARTPYPYRYSDLGFMILQKMVERLLNQPLEDFLQQNFYDPLGAYTTGFNPLNRFPATNIAPTENDKIYRRSRVVGTVHDERAAMMGGISGHAGLFSSANDLAKLGQMLAQHGNYGGYRYYKGETLDLFTAKQFEKSRRGIGWDKPVQSDWNTSPASTLCSPRTFGHTGFTGTCLWVDPEFNVVYIFLSNRVFPDRNNKLLTYNVRTRIQDVIYQSIFSYCSQSQ